MLNAAQYIAGVLVLVTTSQIRPRAAPGSVPATTAPRPAEHAQHFDATTRQVVMLTPVLLLLSMFGAFQVATLWLGRPLGHLTGFVVYWVVFGLLVPPLIVGHRGMLALFRPRPWPHAFSSRFALVLLAVPPVIALLFVFPVLFPATSERTMIAMAFYALVNGTLEETFWRGLFVRVFPRDIVRGVLYPAAMFALWQLIPMSMYSYWPPVEPQWVVGTALALGLLYGWVAWRTQSIRWTVLSHVLTNLAGVGAFFIFRPGA